MIKNTLLAFVLVGGLAATSYAFGAFSTTPEPPCACCGDACTCVDCRCDEEGCACDTGGRRSARGALGTTKLSNYQNTGHASGLGRRLFDRRTDGALFFIPTWATGFH